MQGALIKAALMAITQAVEVAARIGGDVAEIKTAVEKGLARSDVPDAIKAAESHLPENG